jgi:hypothetical protein
MMVNMAEILSEYRNGFVSRWHPDVSDPYCEFEKELDRLIYYAFQTAQEPFVRELEMFKKNALGAGMLKLKP